MTSAAAEKANVVISGKEKLLLVLLLVMLVLAFRELVTGEAATDFVPNVVQAFFSVSGISPQFSYLLVIGLLFVRRKDIAAAYHGVGDPWSAMLFLVPGVSLFLWGHFVDATDLIHVSFILVVFGTARYVSGKRLTRAILPPILILVLATPLPAVLVNQIIFPMQLMDTQHSVWLLNAIGIPALAKGDMITTAESSIRFAESCTALGFSLWLTVFALAYVYLFRIKGWHAVLLVLSAPFIAYGVNLLRAFTLVLNPEMEVLAIHTLQGVVFFLIGFSLLYAVDNLLMRYLPDDSGTHKASLLVPVNGTPATRKQGKLYLLVCLFAALLVASLMVPKWPTPIRHTSPAISLPDELGKWKLDATLPVRYTLLGSVRYSSKLYSGYLRNKEQVWIFIGMDDRLRRNRSLLSGKNAYEDAIGLEQKRSSVNLGPDIGDAVAIISDHRSKRLLTYYWYEGVESVVKEIVYAWLALDQSPFRRDGLARVTRLSTFVELTPEGLKQADKRLRAFLKEMKKAETEAQIN